MKFEVTSFYTLEIVPQTKIQIQNLQSAVTPKEVGTQLWFLYTALLHNVTYLCMKFEVTSFTTYVVNPWIRQTDVRMDRVTPVYPPNLRLCGYKNHDTIEKYTKYFTHHILFGQHVGYLLTQK